MLFYSKLYFSNKTTILFLKKIYIVCITLILMDSNIINVQPCNKKMIKVIMLMYKNNLFFLTKYFYFNSTFHLKNPNIQTHKQKPKHDFHKTQFTPHKYFSL
jgi:hypothetical protein